MKPRRYIHGIPVVTEFRWSNDAASRPDSNQHVITHT
jgi:hypothetical protein